MLTTFLQFWCKLNTLRVSKTFHFVFCVIIMVIDALDVMPPTFPKPLPTFPMVLLHVSLVFLQFS